MGTPEEKRVSAYFKGQRDAAAQWNSNVDESKSSVQTSFPQVKFLNQNKVIPKDINKT